MVALYVFYIVLALLGCAVLLAVVRNRELPANVASGFACGVAAAAALLGQILSQVLAVTDDFAPWLAVLTGAFVAVLLVFLGRTSWNELVAPRESAAAEESVLARRIGCWRRRWRRAPPGAARGEEPEAQALPMALSPPAAPMRPAMPSNWPSRACKAPWRPAAPRWRRPGLLSPRRPKVLVFQFAASRPAYIAKSLVLSISTVRTHVRNIYRKLNVNKREGAPCHLIDKGRASPTRAMVVSCVVGMPSESLKEVSSSYNAPYG